MNIEQRITKALKAKGFREIHIFFHTVGNVYAEWELEVVARHKDGFGYVASIDIFCKTVEKNQSKIISGLDRYLEHLKSWEYAPGGIINEYA